MQNVSDSRVSCFFQLFPTVKPGVVLVKHFIKVQKKKKFKQALILKRI